VVSGAELTLHLADGRRVPVLASAAPVSHMDGGAAPGAVLVLRDVTILRELERLREEWTAIVAHDLRQPVGVIKLAVEQLARRGASLEPPQQKMVERIRGSAERLGRMIEDLLEASRIESRRLTVSPAPIVLADCVREIAERFTEAVPGRPVRVHVEGTPGAALADLARLDQVLSNLLTNAVKYGTPATPIDVEVRRRGGEVEVAVSNSGPGLSAEELAQVFSRFYRTPAAESGAASGLGLGLYISKGIIEALGGRLSAESVPDTRTTFRIVLPAAREAEAEAPLH
jgi:signal transduction histidine kinase